MKNWMLNQVWKEFAAAVKSSGGTGDSELSENPKDKKYSTHISVQSDLKSGKERKGRTRSSIQ